MKLLLCTLATLAALTPCAVGGPPPLGHCLPCVFTEIIDGDSIRAEVRIVVDIRMGPKCYAPETRTTNQAEKRLGLLSKEHLKTLAEGKHGRVFIATQGATKLSDILTLGRVVGEPWVDGAAYSLCDLQVMSGHASTTNHGELGR